MTSNTPRRISLRRKRINDGTNQDNVDAKRKSPLPPLSGNNSSNVPESLPKTPECASSNNHRKKEDEGFFETPVSRRCSRKSSDALEEKTPIYNHYESPSSPFAMSQMLCTQDCEVIWDCSSPGFSKEDIKKMSDKPMDKSFSPSPIAAMPNRLLYGRVRPPAPMPNWDKVRSSTIVAAELDNLLSKVNGESMKALDNDQSSEDEKSTVQLNTNLLISSSQPFDVSGLDPNVSVPENNVLELNALEKYSHPVSAIFKGQDRFKAEKENACGNYSNNINAKCQSKLNDGNTLPKASSGNQPNKQSKDTGGVNQPGRRILSSSNKPLSPNVSTKPSTICELNPRESLDLSTDKKDDVATGGNFSMDDDDLFSESFLIHTQAMEDALFNKDTGKFDSPSVLSKKGNCYPISPLSSIRKRKPVVLFPDVNKSGNRARNLSVATSSPKTVHDEVPCQPNSPGPGNLSPVIRRKSTAVNDDSLVSGISKDNKREQFTLEKVKPFLLPSNGDEKRFGQDRREESTQEKINPFPLSSNSDGKSRFGQDKRESTLENVKPSPFPSNSGEKSRFGQDRREESTLEKAKPFPLSSNGDGKSVFGQDRNPLPKRATFQLGLPATQVIKKPPQGGNLLSSVHGKPAFSHTGNRLGSSGFPEQKQTSEESQTKPAIVPQSFETSSTAVCRSDIPKTDKITDGSLSNPQRMENTTLDKFDDDDEFFASLMPTLVEVEAKHARSIQKSASRETVSIAGPTKSGSSQSRVMEQCRVTEPQKREDKGIGEGCLIPVTQRLKSEGNYTKDDINHDDFNISDSIDWGPPLTTSDLKSLEATIDSSKTIGNNNGSKTISNNSSKTISNNNSSKTITSNNNNSKTISNNTSKTISNTTFKPISGKTSFNKSYIGEAKPVNTTSNDTTKIPISKEVIKTNNKMNSNGFLNSFKRPLFATTSETFTNKSKLKPEAQHHSQTTSIPNQVKVSKPLVSNSTFIEETTQPAVPLAIVKKPAAKADDYDAFGDDDLYLQDDVLKSISRIESQYASSQGQMKGSTCSKGTTPATNSRSSGHQTNSSAPVSEIKTFKSVAQNLSQDSWCKTSVSNACCDTSQLFGKDFGKEGKSLHQLTEGFLRVSKTTNQITEALKIRKLNDTNSQKRFANSKVTEELEQETLLNSVFENSFDDECFGENFSENKDSRVMFTNTSTPYKPPSFVFTRNPNQKQTHTTTEKTTPFKSTSSTPLPKTNSLLNTFKSTTSAPLPKTNSLLNTSKSIPSAPLPKTNSLLNTFKSTTSAPLPKTNSVINPFKSADSNTNRLVCDSRHNLNTGTKQLNTGLFKQPVFNSGSKS